MSEKRAYAHLLFTLLLLLALTYHPSTSGEVTPEILFLKVYTDGFVLVDYELLVDPKFPTQNITLFGEILEDVLVVNKDGLPLDYFMINYTITVYSLGTESVEINYLTQDLTSKEGRYWTLAIDAPTNTAIILPLEASIISLNQVPQMIETIGNRVKLFMNSGLVEVTYVVGVVGTIEHAQLVLDEAERVILEIESCGIIITTAEEKLQEAVGSFNLGNYAEAETLGYEAKNLAIQINQTASQTQMDIAEAEVAISKAQREGRTIGLSEAQYFLNQANDAYDIGNYSQASTFAIQAKTKAEEAVTFLFYGILGAILISVIIFSFLFYKSRKKSKDRDIKKKKLIDIDRIFREHKNLMPEEKQAIQFLVDNNGEAFEAELYDFIKLPRTTTWRLVKRLEDMGIIRTSKFRRQNLIRVKNKYNIKQ